MTERQRERDDAVDVDYLRWMVQSGLDGGDFILLYLWTSFWANGGSACRTSLEAFLHGLQARSISYKRAIRCRNGALTT